MKQVVSLKKLLICMMLVVMVFSSTSCKKDKDIDDRKEKVTEEATEEETEEETEVTSQETTEKEVSEEEKKKTQDDFDAYTQELALQYIEESPLNATFLYGDLESMGLEELLYEIDDASIEATYELIKEAKDVLKELETFPYSHLTKEQQNTYDMLIFQYESAATSDPYVYFENVFQPSQGVQIDIPIALMQIELESELEVQAYLERLTKLPAFYDQVFEYERERAEMGNLLPTYMYDEVIEQVNSMLGEPDEFLIYQGFCDRVDNLEVLTDDQRADYKEQCLEIITNEIYPSFEEMLLVLEEVKAQSTNTKGISEWKNGKAYYDEVVWEETSELKNAEALRQWATEEIEDVIKDAQAYFVKYPEVLEMEDMSVMLNDITTKDGLITFQDAFLKEEFLDYGVERATENIIPIYLEEQLPPAFYFPVSLDLQDYGNMYMAADAYDEMGIGTVETDIHENLPGHHLYFSVLYNSDLPLVRKVFDFDGYTEGWAQYVQGKTYERAATIPEYGEFYAINSRYMYADSVLFDIQVNYDGISKEDAIQYLITNYGYESEEDAESVYNRTLANPGESIHYYYGVYKMNGYLEECKEALGDDFDIKQYHDMILYHGGLPFSVMDGVVDEFIENGGKSE